MTEEELQQEYIGKWFIAKPFTYCAVLPIDDINDIDKISQESSIRRFGQIVNIKVMSSDIITVFKIEYEGHNAHFYEKKGIFVTSHNFNELVFGDTLNDVVTNFNLLEELK